MISSFNLCGKFPLKKLGEITDFLDHLRVPVKSSERVEGSFPYYGANGQQGTIDNFIFDEDLVLLAEDGGNFGNSNRSIAYIARGKYWVNNHAHVLKPRSDLNLDYLFRVLQFYDVTPFVKGATRAKLNKSDAKRIPIPLPPLEEQHRIVELLDRAQALIDKRKEQIGLMDQLIQSLFYDMFGDPVTNPKGWEIVPSIKYSTSIVPGRDKPKSFTGAIPWVTTDDLVHLGRTTVSKKGLGLTGFEIKQVKAKIIPKSSVIMTCVGDLGVVSINECDMVVNQQLHAFQCDTNWLNPTFLMYNLACQTPYMHQMASSTTVPYMNKKVANNTPTIAPPVELQNTFAERVQQIETQKQAMTNSLKELQDNFNSLSQRAFKGELTQ
ncbi:MAG: restriction endonuclease subunit S [Candidatus Electrothrix aestuarii]|uniref:Restriction endonuclease subunit S n=1 Tax=Candidatus Electrothrix aestuarii TaxID=3062594 RepID=A0AAU8LX89_9BACT|nr:restriction endonuclease subunit S [Candidatus Electrothrix aestuarii]